MNQKSRSFTLPNGVVLFPDEHGAPSLTKYAHEKGFTDIRVFFARHPDGTEIYLMVKDREPIHESTQYEVIATHIDVLAMLRDWKDSPEVQP